MAIEIVYCLLALFFSIIILKHIYLNKNKPPSPFALPILGHLHLLKTPLHRTLQTLSNKYGHILFLTIGSLPVLLISSPFVAETCFTTNDAVFANRPKLMMGKHIGYNYTTLVWAPYGDHWRNLRQFAAIHVFSSNSLQTSSAIRNEEVRFLVRQLFRGSEIGTRKVILKSAFFQLTFNVMTRMISGTRCSGAEKIFAPANLVNLCDLLPVLKWVGFKGIESELVKTHEKRDGFAQGLIDERGREKARFSSTTTTTVEKKGKTMVETLLALQEEQPELYSDDIIKGIITVMFTGGTATTAHTMEWAMSLLLNHPEALQKARSEIEEHVEEGNLVEDSDLSKLLYLRCIINETLRLFPVAPLLVPHLSSDECIVGEFKVPRETILLVNAWAIHRNPDFWEEPTKFKPERFKGVEWERKDFKFIPFGMGRRQCPGAGLAMRMVLLGLGALIQCFDWERVGPELVDLTEASEPTLRKLKPLEAIYTPRPSMISLLSQI